MSRQHTFKYFLIYIFLISKDNLDKKKERYIEDQKLKLRNFAPKKMDIDSFAQSLFSQMTPTSSASKSTATTKSSQINHDEISPRNTIELHEQQNSNPLETQNHINNHYSQQKVQENILPKPNIDELMFKCSNLSNHTKLIEKPHLSELNKSASHHDNSANMFKPSEKAANWNSEDLFSLFTSETAQTSTDSSNANFIAEWPQETPSEQIHSLNNMQSIKDINVNIEEKALNVAPQQISPSQIEHKYSVPSWCLSDEVPLVYKQILDASTLNENKEINTELLYPILLLSNVDKKKLAQIWSMVNRETPGQLVKHELYMALALIALVQVC